MAEELLSLKWNNHQSHFVDILSFLREKDMFVDATIACGGKVYSAHKFVLSTCSDYFKQIFTRNPSNNPIVFMKDVSCRDIEALLDFMYHGEVNVPQSCLGSLIKTAEGLQIKGLAVPDDPPAHRRDIERDKRERDLNSSSHNNEHRSPPPKRRIRERHNSPPPRRTFNNHNQQSTTSSSSNQSSRNSNNVNNAAAGDGGPTETSHDGDAASSTNNMVKRSPSPSPEDSSTNNKHDSNTRQSLDDDEDGGTGDAGEDSNNISPAHHQDASSSNALPGTSGLLHSKHEEVEIKQEDIVDLGEDEDDCDWGGGGGLGEDGGGGGDSLSSADNTVNFTDVLMPGTNDGGAAGDDSAMVMVDDTKMDWFVDTGLFNQSTTSAAPYAAGSSLMAGRQNSFYNASAAGVITSSGDSISYRSPASNVRQDRGNIASRFPTPAMTMGTLMSLPKISDEQLRPHKCTYCNKSFKLQHHLKAHVRLHTGEKPYSCAACGASFAQQAGLVFHQKRHCEATIAAKKLQQDNENII